MNPFLLFFAVTLVVLNLACVANLIDWQDPPQTPSYAVSSAAAASPSPAPAADAAHTPAQAH